MFLKANTRFIRIAHTNNLKYELVNDRVLKTADTYWVHKNGFSIEGRKRAKKEKKFKKFTPWPDF